MAAVSTAKDKRILLEQGVKLIEQHILAADPRTKGAKLAIETRKIIVHLGVQHEIDLYIRIVGAPGYDAVYIFECKNWKQKVGKNEIIVFLDKIRVSAAQRGFFVATGFTKDAVAQAAEDLRIKLVEATTEELEEVVSLTNLDFEVESVECLETSLDFFEAGVLESERVNKPIDLDTAVMTLDSGSVNLRAYAMTWQQEVLQRVIAHWCPPPEALNEYTLNTEDERAFPEGQLIVNERTYASAKLSVTMRVRIARPGIRARVDVADRGSALQLEPVKIGEGEVQFWLTSSRRPGM